MSKIMSGHYYIISYNSLSCDIFLIVTPIGLFMKTWVSNHVTLHAFHSSNINIPDGFLLLVQGQGYVVSVHVISGIAECHGFICPAPLHAIVLS